MRLNPIYPVWYLWNLGHAYLLTGQYEEATEKFKKALIRNPDYLPAHIYLAVIYSEQERQEEAQLEVDEIVRLSPQTSPENWQERIPYQDQGTIDRIVEGLRKAGLR